MVSIFFFSYRLAHTFTYNRWQIVGILSSNGVTMFWEQNNPHPSPQGWGVSCNVAFYRLLEQWHNTIAWRGWRRKSVNFLFEASKTSGRPFTPGGTPHMKEVGMLVGNFELNPSKGDRSGRGPNFFWPVKETMLKHRQMRKLGLYEWSE